MKWNESKQNNNNKKKEKKKKKKQKELEEKVRNRKSECVNEWVSEWENEATLAAVQIIQKWINFQQRTNDNFIREWHWERERKKPDGQTNRQTDTN